jgi:hypothetical protein
MIRPLTFLCMLSTIGSGLYLYTEKHSAEMLDRQIGKAIHGTQAARERTGLLRAEWAVLNDPARLQTMADQYLALKPMAPGQFVQMADLGGRLPAAVAPSAQPSASTDDDTAPDATVAAAPAPASPSDVVPTPSPADPGLDDTAPVKVAAQPAPAKAAAHGAAPGSSHNSSTAKLVAHASPRKQHPVAVAGSDGIGRDNPLAHSTPLPLASPQPAGARVMSAMARPVHSSLGGWANARPAVMTATPSSIGGAPYIGSALGGRTALPPAIPLSAQ